MQILHYVKEIQAILVNEISVVQYIDKMYFFMHINHETIKQ